MADKESHWYDFLGPQKKEGPSRANMPKSGGATVSTGGRARAPAATAATTGANKKATASVKDPDAPVYDANTGRTTYPVQTRQRKIVTDMGKGVAYTAESTGGRARRPIAPVDAPAPGIKRPGGGGTKKVKRTTTTVTPTPRPAQADVKPQGSFRGVQSWRGGDVPGQVRYDPGTKPNPTKKQRIAKSGGVHDFSGLKGFFK